MAAPEIRLLEDPGPLLQERFGKIPKPGHHPRILVSPEVLPTLRHLIQTTETGKFVFSRVESFLDALHVPGKPLVRVYEHLVDGDRNAYSYTATDWWKGIVSFAVSMECYDALIRNDDVRGRLAGRALETLATIIEGQSNNEAELTNLAFGYDYDYAYMTEGQRDAVRKVIASATNGKRPYGDSLPSDWRNYNWMPYGMSYLLSALAIEGEEGYDASLYDASINVMKDYLHYGISNSGGPYEEMHYFHYGMQHGALAMVAFARHGDNLFAEPHYLALENWLIASMEPFGGAFSMHQDTPNDEGGLDANYAIMKWVWPDNPVIDMIWRNRLRVGYAGLNYFGEWLVPLVFPSDPKGDFLYRNKLLQQALKVDGSSNPFCNPNLVVGIEALKLPRSYWDPERGLLITRDKWGCDGLVFHFDGNVQAYGPSHYHSNSTMFTLSALGRKWVIDRGFRISETKDSSLITIDGRGQGFFPVGGRTVEYTEIGKLTTISTDASEPYHWMTNSQIQIGSPYLNRFIWEPDTSDHIVKKYSEIAAVDKEHPWKDNATGYQYIFRASYNPVEKAFRTAALRRDEPHSYVLIIDDIKKDKNIHRYEWLMQIADDLEIISKNDNGIVLGNIASKDTRQLFIKMIGARGPGEWELEKYDIKRSPETGDTSSFGTGKRLRYIVQAIEPEFKVFIYPHLAGEPLPAFFLSSDSLLVRWPDKEDSYELKQLTSGRTSLRMLIP